MNRAEILLPKISQQDAGQILRTSQSVTKLSHTISTVPAAAVSGNEMRGICPEGSARVLVVFISSGFKFMARAKGFNPNKDLNVRYIKILITQDTVWQTRPKTVIRIPKRLFRPRNSNSVPAFSAGRICSVIPSRIHQFIQCSIQPVLITTKSSSPFPR